MGILADSLIQQMMQDYESPIIIVPESYLKKKKVIDESEEVLGTRLDVTTVSSPRIPSPSPG